MQEFSVSMLKEIIVFVQSYVLETRKQNAELAEIFVKNMEHEDFLQWNTIVISSSPPNPSILSKIYEFYEFC